MNLDLLNNKRIAVLLGGESPEREISLMSGACVEGALQESGYTTVAIDSAQPRWWLQLDVVDLAFICLHGAGGEDGVVQGALETLGIPYTGSGVLASALAMDKLRSKRLWRGIGLATPDFEELSATSDWQAVIDKLGGAFVKPVNGGSSLGTGAADTAESLEVAWQQATHYGDRVMAERLIDGAEYTVAILGDEALPAIKMETDNKFYDYQAKYFSDETRYLCPCGLSEAEEAEMAEMAHRAFESLGCEVWGRVDFMRDSAGAFLVLEVNTVPGMTGHSLVPMAANVRGISLPELVGRIACLSLERN